MRMKANVTATPWGLAQTVRCMSETIGIWSVSTESHGGIYVDQVANSMIPEYMRSRGGWYEEDCDWCIPAVVFPDSFPDRMRNHAKDALRAWHPAMYERFYCEVIPAGASHKKDREGLSTDRVWCHG